MDKTTTSESTEYVPKHLATNKTAKEFNCPDCERTDSCEGCYRVELRYNVSNKIMSVPKYFPDSLLWPQEQYIPPACRNCSKHPSNGGDGICFCTLGTPTIY